MYMEWQYEKPGWQYGFSGWMYVFSGGQYVEKYMEVWHMPRAYTGRHALL